MKGTLYMVSAPSGCGKTSLIKALLESDATITLSTSYTTRPLRGIEKSGVQYHFISKKQFEAMIKAQDFLEHAKVFDYYYGTSAKWVTENLEKGIDTILEIDWQGVEQIKTRYPEAVTIFLLPPSRASLTDRIIKRGEDTADIIDYRLKQAPVEMSHCTSYDYIVINDRFEKALLDIKTIIQSNRLRTTSQQNLVQELLSQYAN